MCYFYQCKDWFLLTSVGPPALAETNLIYKSAKATGNKIMGRGNQSLFSEERYKNNKVIAAKYQSACIQYPRNM